MLSVTKHDQLIHLARCGNPSAKNASRDVADERLSIAATRRLMRALDPSTDYAGSGAEIVRSQQYAAVAYGSGERTLLGIACPISIEQRPPVAIVTALAKGHRGRLATIVAPVHACALSITRAIRAMPEFY
ncbi:hypothetical protein [Pilimelia columellifera]|uniref:hypothetical protein n=1 Tax=Pilimelia columellifera TaxID=706574 RepID=UPI0031D1C22B